MAQPVIEVNKLKKVYDDRTVLDISHLEFEKGLIYALVGPNGSGKTTLLKLINLLDSPTDGEIRFNGQGIDISSSNALEMKRLMTLVMQNAVLFRSSVYKNIAYGLKIRSYNKSRIHSSVMSTLDMVGLHGFENRKARKLSAGEAQRAALARAVVLDPEILLMDEPTANVDRRNIRTIETLLGKINSDRGTTIIFTTHDLAQAYRMTHNVISLLDGKIISGGSENIIYGSFGKDNNQSFINISQDINIKVSDFNQESVAIYINPHDINISINSEDHRTVNCFKGHVTSVTILGSNVRLTVDIGIELVSLISYETFREMASVILTKDVYATFGISNVNVF